MAENKYDVELDINELYLITDLIENKVQMGGEYTKIKECVDLFEKLWNLKPKKTT